MMKPPTRSWAASKPYEGIANLESMEFATNYQDFLGGLIADLARHVGLECTLVDLGAGMGTYAKKARSLGFRIMCVEADPQLQQHLKDEGFATTTLPALPTGSQQAIFSFNVMEHIDDDIGVMREIFRVMAPNGWLLLYVPAFPILYSSMDALVGHVRRYRRQDLVDKVASVGFSVEWCRYADSLGFLASLIYRLAPRASGELTPRSTKNYDKYLFPLSRRIDSLTHRWFGKNLVLTARRVP